MISSKRLVRWVSGLVILCLVVAGLPVSLACSKSAETVAVVLEFSPDPAGISGTGTAFDEKNSQVLRCVSVTENENGLTASVTKTKSAEIESLIFVNLTGEPDSELSTVEIACVNPAGEEGNYDISQAVFRTVKLASAVAAVNGYGLPYEDWLTGTMSQDELFPCCQ